MAVYANSEQLYTCFQHLFDRLEAQNGSAAQPVLNVKMRFRFRFSDPTAELMIDARQRPLQVIYGSSSQRPDLDVALSADTLHQILLGELSLTKAVGSKRLRPKGPVWKTAVLADLFDRAKQIYPQLVRELKIAA